MAGYRTLGLACALTLATVSFAAAAAAADAPACSAAARSATSDRGGTATLMTAGCMPEALQHSLALAETGKDALAFNDAAVIAEKLGRYADALAWYDRALSIADDPATRATLLVNAAALQYRLGNFAAAVQAYQRVLRTLESASSPDAATLAATLGGLGLAEQTIGRYDDAQAHLERALALDEKRLGASHPDVALDLSNLGDLFRSRGDFNRVLPLYQRALAIRQATLQADHIDTSNSLNKLAYALENLGQQEQALLLSRQALAMRERILPAGHPFIASAHTTIGSALRRLHRLEEARASFGRALAMRRVALPPKHPDIAETLHQLGWLLQQSGDLPGAETHLREALAIRDSELGATHARTAETMGRLASVLADAGRRTESTPLLQRALAIAMAAGVPETQFAVGGLLAADYHAQGFDPQAIFVGKLAINAMQRIRVQSGALDPALQRSLLQENGSTYRALAGLLVDAGRLVEAEQVLAMLKEVELADLVQRSDVQRTQVDFAGGEGQAARAGDALASRAVAESAEVAALQRRLRAGEKLPDADRARLTALRAQQVQWQIDFEQWVGALKTGLQPPDKSQLLARGTDMQTLVRPDPGAVGLSYVVGEQRLAIVVTTANGSFGREVPVTRVDVNRMVAAMRQAIHTRADVRPAANALYRVLIAPVAADLAAAKATTLVLSLTESLRYLPFAALQDGDDYLVQRYALVNWLQAGGTPAGATAGNWQIAGLGAARGAQGFSPLPAVPGELSGIVRDSKHPDGVLPGQVLLDDAFDRGGLDQALSGEFNVVHIASHFDFRPGDSTRSVLLLGNGATVSLRELATMDYLSVQLLTLSACNTASGGGINENGAEVEGLAAAVRRQGARSVLASLWPVADASTAALMQRFYTGHATGRAKALQQAQLSLLRGAGQDKDGAVRGVTLDGAASGTAAPSDPSRPWAHPYYWAPFVLSGDWL